MTFNKHFLKNTKKIKSDIIKTILSLNYWSYFSNFAVQLENCL